MTINDIIKEWYKTISQGKKMKKREFIEKNNTHIESKDIYYYYFFWYTIFDFNLF